MFHITSLHDWHESITTSWSRCSLTSDYKVHMEVAGSWKYETTAMPKQLFALHYNQGYMHLVTIVADQGSKVVICTCRLTAWME